MGGTGRAHVEHSAHCAGSSGKFPPGNRLGRIYRCGYHGAEQSGQAYRIHPVGKPGAEEESDAEQSEASDPDGASSQPAVSIPGILRQQAFQQDK